MSFLPTVVPINLFRNADFELAVRWVDTDGTPFPLSDLKMQVREADDPESDLFLEASVANGRSDLGEEPDYWSSILIPAEAIAAVDWPQRLPFYDIVAVRSSDGRRRRVRQGRVLVSPGVTA